MSLTYLSVCSGIEATSVAWHPLGFTPLGFAEIDPFACSVLAHRFPGVTNFGDLTGYRDWSLERDPDIVVGGTPCQSFSVAGLRKGMADPRGNLALTFLGLVDRVKPTWVVWENVPGVLSSWSGDVPPSDLEPGQRWESTETSDFGCFLDALSQLGYGFAYRVLDAQYFGVPQRRRRVFVVGHRGDWRRAAAVLFDSQSMRGNPTPSRKAGKETSGTLASRTSAGGGLGTDFDLSGGLVAGTLQASGKAAGSATQQDAESGLLVAHTLRGEGFDASEDGCGRGTPLVPVAFSCKDHGSDAGEISPTLREMPHDGSHSNGGGQVAIVAIQERAVSENLKNGPGGSGFRTDGVAYTLEARSRPQAIAFHGSQDPCVSIDAFYAVGQNQGQENCVAFQCQGSNVGEAGTLRKGNGNVTGGVPFMPYGVGVRRLMPIECERLQGFPDNWTLVPHGPRSKLAADGPRYKAIGNSMAVPVMAWIGQRIKFVDSLKTQGEA